MGKESKKEWIYVDVCVTDSGFPGDLDSKQSACRAGDLGSIPGSGRFPGEENDYPLQYSCLENSISKRA